MFDESIIKFLKDKILIGDDSLVDTPLPIPNREVKHFNADDSVSENRKLPIFFMQ